MKVCFSGTFNILHKGHKSLIDTAFKTAGKNGTVYIGVTKGKLSQKKGFMIPFAERVATLQGYLEAKGYEKRAVILAISNKYGPAVSEDYDAIIVSPETYETAQDINTKRVAAGKKPLAIITIPYILAEDKKPISATRILKGEIDENGKSVQR